MIISMGMTMAIQNSRTLAQNLLRKIQMEKPRRVLQREPKYYSKIPMATTVLDL